MLPLVCGRGAEAGETATAGAPLCATCAALAARLRSCAHSTSIVSQLRTNGAGSSGRQGEPLVLAADVMHDNVVMQSAVAISQVTEAPPEEGTRLPAASLAFFALPACGHASRLDHVKVKSLSFAKPVWLNTGNCLRSSLVRLMSCFLMPQLPAHCNGCSVLHVSALPTCDHVCRISHLAPSVHARSHVSIA